MEINLNGKFYTRFLERHSKSPNPYSPELQDVIYRTVDKLLKQSTSEDKPGMLLGKIQSGKTKTFLGVIALAFDNGFDIAVVFTKGTVALAKQTTDRINADFSPFIEEDLIQVYDALEIPENLTAYILDQKLILVSKKEINNLSRLTKAIFEKYKDLSDRKVLIIDDEADHASIGFKNSKDDGLDIKPIPKKIDIFRTNLVQASFLQVTATPYSLYLQPDDLVIEDRHLSFKPVKPTFTELVPVHENYIGGNYYFNESEDRSSTAFFLYQPVTNEELGVLEKADARKFRIENCLISEKITSLRNAVLNFIVGGIIRRLQEKKNIKYSFIIHTKTSKNTHGWQHQIVSEIIKQLEILSNKGDVEFLDVLIRPAYENLTSSINLEKLSLPEYTELFSAVREALNKGFVRIEQVNSDKDVNRLLDSQGQLKLTTPLNIFIGGQILDRGITITNLIGFYYGRAPKKFQQDTVLQHSRMFGFRSKDDLAVTRFYTSSDIYDAMKKIQEIDSTLRESISNGDQEIIFIQKDEHWRLIPCSPNKILLSTTITLKPYKRLLPIGFQTDYKSNIEKYIKEIDSKIEKLSQENGLDNPFLIDLDDASLIVKNIYKTFVFEDGCNVTEKSFIASLEHLSRNSENLNQKGKVWCLVRRNRNLNRLVKIGHATYADAPDTATTEGKIARQTAIDAPILMLFRQNGLEEQGWRGAPFYWPVLVAQKNIKVSVFASDINKK